VRVLLALGPTAAEEATVERLAASLARRHPVVVAAGRGTTSLRTVDRTLRESRQVADALRSEVGDRLVHRLEDVHLRGLLALFGDDDRLRLFVARELDVLRRHDAEHGTSLLEALDALLRHPAGKSEAASGLHLSRPAFYARLAKIESLLGAGLDDPDIRVSLHVALIADELSGTGG